MTIDWRATLTSVDAALAGASPTDAAIGRQVRGRLHQAGTSYDVSFPPAPAPDTPTVLTETAEHVAWRGAYATALEDLDEFAQHADGRPAAAIGADLQAARVAVVARLQAVLDGLDATSASYTAAPTLPTSFSGGETLTIEIDGDSLPVVFTVDDQGAAAVVRRINALASIYGFDDPIAEAASGALTLRSPSTGAASTVGNATGTAVATLGLSGLVSSTVAGFDAVELEDDVRSLVARALEAPMPPEPSFYAASFYARPSRYHRSAGEAEVELVAALAEAAEWLAAI